MTFLKEPVHTQQKQILARMNKCIKKICLRQLLDQLVKINGHQLKLHLADVQRRQTFAEEKTSER